VISLKSASLQVLVDPDYGADITSISCRRTGEEVLFQAPWRDHAQRAIDNPSERIFSDSELSWLERYRGGWQILCPTAGKRDSTPEGSLFHGEASRRSWTINSENSEQVELGLRLETATLDIARSVRVEGSTVTVTDELVNTGDSLVRFDLSQHVALGGDLLDGECSIGVDAQSFFEDQAMTEPSQGNVKSEWLASGLDLVPAKPSSRFALGWLSDFTETAARFRNESRDITVTLRWSPVLPYAWLWQELDYSPNWPWLSRTRVLGFEPSSTPTSGPERNSSAQLAPGESLTVDTSLTVAGPAELSL